MTASLWVALTLQALPAPGPQLPAEYATREAWIMGTRARIAVEGEDRPAALAVSEAALREIERFEALLSTWDSTSALSLVNRAPASQPIEVSTELAELLAEARGWAERTEGAFNPAVGALIRTWDLRGSGRIPNPTERLDIVDRITPASFTVDVRQARVVRYVQEVQLESGGFGKGAALRSAARLLARNGVRRALLDLGGQIWAQAPANAPWRIGVADPRDRERSVTELRLHGVSVATSGASERWVEVDGRRLSHIVDPRTGEPAPAWGSVTVVASDPLVADVLSTALFVMGPEEGMRWLDGRDLDVGALFLQERRGALEISWNPPMARWMVEPHDLGNLDPRSTTKKRDRP